MTLVIVDCEAVGPCPSLGALTEFGAVILRDSTVGPAFHGVIHETRPSEANPAIPEIIGPANDPAFIWRSFRDWLGTYVQDRPSFVSDNPAYDWQWVNDGLWTYTGGNPFGHSARRIGDFAAGLSGRFSGPQGWKKLRQTPHTHNPVDDARGNAEALLLLMKGYRHWAPPPQSVLDAVRQGKKI